MGLLDRAEGVYARGKLAKMGRGEEDPCLKFLWSGKSSILSSDID